MATDKTKNEKELTVEERLKALYELQTLLSEIDRIKTIRGELPLEVQDLEDEIAGLETRIQKYKAEVDDLRAQTVKKKHDIEQAKALIDKYTEQQNNVRNNREFDFLSKEIEFQNLELELVVILKILVSANSRPSRNKRQRTLLLQTKLLPTVSTSSVKRRANSMKLYRKPSRTKSAFAKKPRNSKLKSTRACSPLSNASARAHATAWVSFTFSVTLAAAASTAFHRNARWKSRCTRKSSFANTVVAL